MTHLKNVSENDLKVIENFSPHLRKLRLELVQLFPERGWLINQIIHALVTGNNVLIYGPHGTAKTLLATTVLESITGKGIDGEDPELFVIQVDNSTTKDDLIGDPDIPEYEKTGILTYRVEGHLPKAHFAVVDEIFDAPGILRGLNDILNEHELREGDQTVPVPLLTAIAATNRSPEEITQMLDWLNLPAFNDRFLFISEVDYLTDSGNKDRMIENFLESATLTTDIPFAGIQQLVEIIKRTNQFSGRAFVQVYRQAMEAFSDASGVSISDRRLVWLTQLVESSAIVQGRHKLYFDDIRTASLGLCRSEDDPNLAIFDRVVTPILEEAKATYNEDVDRAVRVMLDSTRDAVNSIEKDFLQERYSNKTNFVGESTVELNKLIDDLENTHPALDSNERDREILRNKAENLKQEIANLF